MSVRRPRPLAFLVSGIGLAAPCLVFAQAQATVKPDGEFRYALTAAGSYASGNTDAASANLDGQAVRATAIDKLLFGTKGVWSRNNGVVTANNLAVGSEYDRDLTPRWFTLGKADYLRDLPAKVATRYSLFGGFGRHLVRSDALTFDISTGLGYTHDHYTTPLDVNGGVSINYARFEALLAEETTQKLTTTTTLHQKLSVFPALRSGGGYRAVFDSGLSVAMTPVLSLTVGVNYRYNSNPGQGQRPSDTLATTGLTVRID